MPTSSPRHIGQDNTPSSRVAHSTTHIVHSTWPNAERNGKKKQKTGSVQCQQCQQLQCELVFSCTGQHRPAHQQGVWWDTHSAGTPHC